MNKVEDQARCLAMATIRFILKIRVNINPATQANS